MAPGLPFDDRVPPPGNRFEIAGGRPGLAVSRQASLEVSWQAGAVRADPAAVRWAVPAEQDKPTGDRGRSLDPELCGQPASNRGWPERDVAVARRPRPCPRLVAGSGEERVRERGLHPSDTRVSVLRGLTRGNRLESAHRREKLDEPVQVERGRPRKPRAVLQGAKLIAHGRGARELPQLPLLFIRQHAHTVSPVPSPALRDRIDQRTPAVSPNRDGFPAPPSGLRYPPHPASDASGHSPSPAPSVR